MSVARYSEALTHMQATFETFYQIVPPPQLVEHGDRATYRFVEQRPIQAILLKLARVVSGLHALLVLNRAGLFQEQAAIQRTLDEFVEDIYFLASAPSESDLTDLQAAYLAAFWQEEYTDPADPVGTRLKRPMVDRKKIVAHNARITAEVTNVSDVVHTMVAVNKLYSGFVHGAAPHIMDMCAGIPPQFHLHGMNGTPLESTHARDMWNYFYRGICAFECVASKIAGPDADALQASIRSYRKIFGAEAGEGYSKSPAK